MLAAMSLFSAITLTWAVRESWASEAPPRDAQVAGAFYPGEPSALRALVTRLLEQHPLPTLVVPAPRALILPHAGYVYSGVIAAAGIRQVQGRAYDAVAVVGFTHRAPFAGVSVDDRPAYRTPLGTIPVDREAVQFLLTQPRIRHVEAAHASDEHSLEVMLPFLQVALGTFRVIPVLMGGVDPADAHALAEVLAVLAQRRRILCVFSTDLSHYYPYDEAKRLDEATVHAMLAETPHAVARLFDAGQLEACGRGPIVTALFLAQRLGYLDRRLLAYANSGDTAGDRSRVVGYAAIGLYDRPPPQAEALPPAAGAALVQAARRALAHHFQSSSDGVAPMLLAEVSELARAQGLFVTLRRDGQLRGCIGRIESTTPLTELLPTVALDAALRDPRFPPLAAEELSQITVEVSVLTPPRLVQGPHEIVAGRDGVVLRRDGTSGVFLPQVWAETGWTRLEFLRQLAQQKAGLDPNAWRQAELFTFQDQVFSEDGASSGTTPH